MDTLISIIKDHIEWRRQLFILAKNDLIKTYSGAAFGWAWAIVKPAVMIAVFWFALAIGLRMAEDVNGYAGILWLIAGLIPWFYMSDAITGGAQSILKYDYLVTKMKFPVGIIPTIVNLSKFYVHLFLMGITVVIFLLYGFPPDIYMLQLPIYMALMFAFFVAWSLFSSMLSSISKDFRNLVKALVQAIFWMSGILWNINKMSDYPVLQDILMYNPVTYIAEGYRNVFIHKIWIWEEPRQLINYFIVLIAMIILAVWSYKRLYKEIPDVI
jgi:teichoic acid transport system permease protein